MENNINEIKIIYKFKEIKDSKRIRIFGDEFIENNRNNCELLINNESEGLKAFIDTEDINNKNIIEIKLIGLNKIKNMSHMFSDCELLKELPDISKLNTNNVNNIRGIFYDCSS